MTKAVLPTVALGLVLAFALLGGCPQHGLAQPYAVNPFDLVSRLDSTIQVASTSPTRQGMPSVNGRTQSLPAGIAAPRNPFDLLHRRHVPIISESDKAIAQPPAEPTSMPDEGASEGSTFNLWLIAALLLLLTGSYLSQGPAMRRLLGAAFNENFLSRLRRDPRKGSYLWWTFAGLLSIGVFLHVALRTTAGVQLHPDWSSFGFLLLALVGIVFAKAAVLGVLQAAFPLDVPIETYRSLAYVMVTGCGLLLLPVTIVAGFAAPPLALGAAYLGLVLFGLAYVVFLFRAVAVSSRFVLSFPLHFLLYLCALEIGPVAVGYKLLTG